MVRKKFYIYTIIICAVLLNAKIFAQEDSTITVDPFEDNKEYDFNFSDSDWDFGSFGGKPTISINYGFSNVGINDITTKLTPVNAAEVRIGYLSEYKKFQSNFMTKYKYKYFSLANTSYDLSDKNYTIGDFRTKSWQFGFGFESGYGYKLGSVSIIPYNAYGFNWSRIDVSYPTRVEHDIDIVQYFDQSTRFGTMAEGGIKIRLITNLCLDAGYQREIVMPRVLFWKATGSVLMECAAQWGVEEFVDRVLDSSPSAAPIVNFVLKNALSYGIYELRKEKMNWPFETASPFAFNTFKVGMTFIF